MTFKLDQQKDILLFPTPVGVNFYDKELTKQQIDFILELEKSKNTGNLTTVNKTILNHELFLDLKKFIFENVEVFYKKWYSPPENTSIYLTQSWANYTEQGSFHHRHYHFNSLVSCVFYPLVSEDENELDKIIFHSSHSGHSIFTRQFGVEPVEFNPFNSQSWWIPVKKNQLIIFPSTLEHSVENKPTTGTRISISANTFIEGDLGNAQNLTHLHLNKSEIY
jgi:uncharacterized protein (TIGR02466 family)